MNSRYCINESKTVVYFIFLVATVLISVLTTAVYVAFMTEPSCSAVMRRLWTIHPPKCLHANIQNHTLQY